MILNQQDIIRTRMNKFSSAVIAIFFAQFAFAQPMPADSVKTDTARIAVTVPELVAKPDSNAVMTKADSILAYAKTFIGVTYKYASASPTQGFDCSGFVSYVFNHFGYKLPRSSKDYGTIGTKVELADCQPGDIMVFAGGNPQRRPIGHVGIVVENKNGDVHFIHSATSKHRGVVISHYNSIKYYTQRLVSIRRVI